MIRLSSDSIMKSIEVAHQMLVKLVNRKIGTEEIPQIKNEHSAETSQESDKGFDEIA